MHNCVCRITNIFFMCNTKQQFFGIIVACVASTIILYCLSKSNIEHGIIKHSRYTNYKHLKQHPIIVWWTPFLPTNTLETLECGEVKCYLTQNRNYTHGASLTAFLFYGSNFNVYDLPLPRSDTVWALLHEESPKNNAALLYPHILRLFNISSTFSRYSDFPVTLQHLPSREALIDPSIILTVTRKSKLMNKLAPILYVQSDCDTPIQRDAYVQELMKYIPIDSYGQCLNNKKLPDIVGFAETHITINHDKIVVSKLAPSSQLIAFILFLSLQTDYLNNLYSKNVLQFVAQYKFVLAIENAVCDDYITEKLWRPLIAGSIPVYKGSPSVRDWLPNKQSAILIGDFANPKRLAEHILKIHANQTLYNEFRQHKLAVSEADKITNVFLLNNLNERKWGTDSNNNKYNHFINEFQCFVCKFIMNEDNLKNVREITSKHYNCPLPVPLIHSNRNGWLEHWYHGNCEAQATYNLVYELKLSNYTNEMLHDEIRRLKLNYLC